MPEQMLSKASPPPAPRTHIYRQEAMTVDMNYHASLLWIVYTWIIETWLQMSNVIRVTDLNNSSK